MQRRVLQSSAVIFACYFLGVLAGLAVPQRQKEGKAAFGERLLRNRLESFGWFPLRHIGRAMIGGDIPRTAVLMGAVNLTASVFHFVAGLLYLSPLLAATQGFMLGAMLAVRGSARVCLFSAVVLPFEVGAFALSGGLGMERASRWLAARRGASGQDGARGSLRWGLPAVVALQGLGGALEAVSAIRLRLPGVLSTEEIARVVDAPRQSRAARTGTLVSPGRRGTRIDSLRPPE